MRANTACREVSSPRCTVDQRRHCRTTGQRDEGRIHPKKHMFIANVRAPVLYVIQNGIADVLRQREHALSSSLSIHLNSAVIPIDVGMTQMYDIASTQSKPNQEQKHRPISCSLGCRRITGDDEFLDFL